MQEELLDYLGVHTGIRTPVTAVKGRYYGQRQIPVDADHYLAGRAGHGLQAVDAWRCLCVSTRVYYLNLPKSGGRMGRMVRDARIETREARLRLKARHEPYWRLIHAGLHLGYRKGPRGGVWMVRVYSGERYRKKRLGNADDNQDGDGQNVLSFRQAQEKLLKATKDGQRHSGSPALLLTIAQATESYLVWFRSNRKSLSETQSVIQAHILPALGHELVTQLSASRIRAWLEKLAETPARTRTSHLDVAQKFRRAPKTSDQRRARQATANRVLNVLKAILNRAFHSGFVTDDTAWRQVKPFPKVDEARIRFLTDAESTRLVNACRPDLRGLVRAALLTGCRYGELVALKIRDVNLGTALVYIAESKSGKPRYVPLNGDGVKLFRNLVAGKTAEELVFVKQDGTRWGKNHQVRLLAEACAIAKVRPAIAFHQLRHTYASNLAQAGVSMAVIAKLLGHADDRTTQKHYAHLSDKELADAVTRLPRIGEGTPNLTAIK